MRHYHVSHYVTCEYKIMTRKSSPPDIGVTSQYGPTKWVQTERKAHEEWAMLGIRKPIAAAVLHKLVAAMGHQNAVVVGQKTLAMMLGVHDRSISRAVADLVAEQWIQVVKIGKGKEVCYVVNDRVAWGQPRDQLRLSVFSATVVASAEDQDETTMDNAPLRRIPTLYPGERQLPSGPGAEPPSQPSIPGMEPDLPALHANRETGEIAELEAKGQQRLVD